MLRAPQAAGELAVLRRHADDALEDAGLPKALVACFRSHPHVSNVLTHIGGARWDRIEAALVSLLDPAAGADELLPLARNLLDLLYAERGVTGRILKPFFLACVGNLAGSDIGTAIAVRLDGLQVHIDSSGTALPFAAGSGRS